MKFNFVILISAALVGASGYSQTSGGAGGGATGSAGTGGSGAGASGTVGANGAGVSGTAGAGVRVNPPPPLLPGGGPPRPQTPNPNLPKPGQVPPGQNGAGQNGAGIQTFATNAVSTPIVADTNQAVLNGNQNQIGGNQVGLGTSNQFGADQNLAPTSQAGSTNRVMATNAPGSLTNNSQLMRDQAVSEADRRLLAQIQTAVFGPSGAPAPLGGTAVHFILRDGAVRIVGFVPNVEEQKRIENIVRQVPGVLRVYDALQIGVSAAPGVPGQ